MDATSRERMKPRSATTGHYAAGREVDPTSRQSMNSDAEHGTSRYHDGVSRRGSLTLRAEDFLLHTYPMARLRPGTSPRTEVGRGKEQHRMRPLAAPHREVETRIGVGCSKEQYRMRPSGEEDLARFPTGR